MPLADLITPRLGRRASCALTVALMTVSALAAEARADDPRPPTCTRLVGVRLTRSGAPLVTIELRGERISAITTGDDRGLSLPDDPACVTIDGAGALATPGFIDPLSRVGLVELDSEAHTHDHDNRHPLQPAESPVRAVVDTALAWNARSVLLPVTRLEGVTTVIAAPGGGVLSGYGVAADLLVGPRADALIARRVAHFGTIGPRHESRAGGLFVLARALEEARRWPTVKAAFEKNAHAGLITPWLDLEALQPVVRGEVPLVVTVNRASDIEALLEVVATPTFATPNIAAPMGAAAGIPLVLNGAAEAWMLAPELARRRVAVILDPLLYGPGGFDELHARPDAAAILAAAGVRVMFAQGDPHQSRKLRQLAGNAVREGMSWEAALAALTTTPAEVFALAGHGRLAVGAIATVALWDGDPLEVLTSLRWLAIRGRPIARQSRQTELYERHR
jgi:imidazolonepropionase-like amidohydrolase